jgi:hypothetical protein
MVDDKDKGEWAETADEGIVPDELGGPGAPDPQLGSSVTGRTAGSDEPATEEGVDRAAGDEADATTDGGSQPPPGEEPDQKDIGGAALHRDRD